MQKRLVLVLVAMSMAGALLFGLSFLRTRATSFVPYSFRLPNGLEAQVASGNCGTNAALVVSFAVGANQDPPGRSGMVQVVQRLLSAPGGPGRIVQTLSDRTLYSVVAPHEKILEEVDALAARMTNPEFTDAGLAAAKAQVAAEIQKRIGTDATLTAITDASESVLPSSGNGRRGGLVAEIDSIELAAINAFWKAHFTPGNARLIVLGDVNHEKTRARIEQDFGKLPTGTPAVSRATGDMTVSGTLVMGNAPTAVAIAVRAPPLKDLAFPGFLVLSARLMKESPADHEWTVSYDPLLQPELLLVTGPVRPREPPEPAAGRIRKSVDAVLARPLSSADVDAADAQFGLLLGKFDHDDAGCERDPRGLAIALLRRAEIGVDAQRLTQAIDGLTPAQLAEGAAFFSPTRTAAVIAGGVNR